MWNPLPFLSQQNFTMSKHVLTTLTYVVAMGHIVSADLLRVSGGNPLPRHLEQPFTLDSRSTSCPATCTSNDGNTICIPIADVCCQNSGGNPFGCPVDYPYCCADQLCGNSASCAGPIVNDGGSPKKSMGNSGHEWDDGVRSGLFAMIIGAIYAVLL